MLMFLTLIKSCFNSSLSINFIYPSLKASFASFSLFLVLFSSISTLLTLNIAVSDKTFPVLSKIIKILKIKKN